MFPSPYVPPTSSPVPMFPSPIPQKLFPFPMFPTHVPQCLCSPNMFPSPCMFPQLVHQFLCSPVRIFPDHSYYIYILNRYYLCNNVFVCIFMKIGEGHFWIWGGTHLGRVAHISFIRIVIIASPKTMTGEHREWSTGWGDTGTGEHRDWGTCLGSIGTGEHLIYRDWGSWDHGDWGT